jgi:tetratricopeptide (TPR) repeat protein
MRKLLILVMLCVGPGMAQQAGLERARELYQRTEYQAALDVLDGLTGKSAELFLLLGKCYYMRGEFKKSSDALEQAGRLAPYDSQTQLWLGRAYGRRAETSNFLTAPGLAGKARDRFARAVALDPGNADAAGDLFEYYMQAPALLGGGVDKATSLAERFKDADPAEYHYRLAQLARKRKDLKTTEEELRRAMEAAPGQVGRIIDLAQLLASERRYQESDALFVQAEQAAPASAKLLFERARACVEAGRDLDKARELLARYLKSPLTPDDPPRGEAEQLLKRAGAG